MLPHWDPLSRLRSQIANPPPSWTFLPNELTPDTLTGASDEITNLASDTEVEFATALAYQDELTVDDIFTLELLYEAVVDGSDQGVLALIVCPADDPTSNPEVDLVTAAGRATLPSFNVQASGRIKARAKIRFCTATDGVVSAFVYDLQWTSSAAGSLIPAIEPANVACAVSADGGAAIGSTFRRDGTWGTDSSISLLDAKFARAHGRIF